ncbi:tyrosine-type recombinase/integrase [Rummeliibacillus pycnus]|uniref:tyrosine-type recombinase/integrase n=1 Tax=Rummeliibacillus pycnus TaxID=101070 RepID=UPI003899D299
MRCKSNKKKRNYLYYHYTLVDNKDNFSSFQISSYGFQKKYQFQKKYNLKPITTHGLRHTHYSLLFEAGVSIKEVQDRLGHIATYKLL